MFKMTRESMFLKSRARKFVSKITYSDFMKSPLYLFIGCFKSYISKHVIFLAKRKDLTMGLF